MLRILNLMSIVMSTNRKTKVIRWDVQGRKREYTSAVSKRVNGAPIHCSWKY